MSADETWTTTTPSGDSAILSYLPLDPAALETSVRSEKDGAVVTFVGYTRDNFQGRTVTHLTYESYVSLALKTLHALLLRVRTLPPPPPLPDFPTHHCASHSSSTPSSSPSIIELGRIRVAHLLGPSPPLTPSIVITVASPHRREAFYACEWMLEMVKREVQVWKREWYAADERSEKAGGGKEGEERGEVFVGRDGEGPKGFGGRAHEKEIELEGLDIRCLDSEYRTITPPAGRTCGDWLNPYVEQAGGYILDANASADCQYCTYSQSSDFFIPLSQDFSKRGNDIGYFVCYCAFNCVLTVFGARFLTFCYSKRYTGQESRLSLPWTLPLHILPIHPLSFLRLVGLHH
ncbi:hypothetical protein JCM8547_002673 [Rhodosporidiobolus lusitaniae]